GEWMEAVGVAGPCRPHTAMVAAAGAVTPAPIATPMPIFEEVVAPESNSSVAPLFGEVYAKTGSSRIRVLAVFGALLLLAGGGLWGYIDKGGDKRAAAADASAVRDYVASAMSGQTAPADPGGAVSPPRLIGA